MPRFGFIRDELDIKMLILFVLSRLSAEVDPDTLYELVSVDDGFDYFQYVTYLAELVDNEHITETPSGYTITEKGKRNIKEVESSLPYSVRTKAAKLCAPVDAKMRRDAMIITKHTVKKDGVFVKLAMSDGKGYIIDLTLLCGSEAQAELMEKNFRREAEQYYHRTVEMLSKK